MYAKAAGEPPRVMPSRARKADPAAGAGADPDAGGSGGAGAGPDAGRRSPTGRRVSTKPLVEIARAATKEEALAAFERWRGRHAAIVDYLQPADILVDAMRGRFTLWYRIRVNLEHVPVAQRPPQEPLEVDYNPWSQVR
jgi:hypothetical protein